MFRDIIRCNYVCCVYGKVTFKKVNQLRYDSVSKKYQATVQLNSVLLIACFPLCLQRGKHAIKSKALVFLRLAEYHLKNAYSKSQLSGIHINFLNVPSHE